jgi:leader peptidase (prepilin peptidase)/N-methyltransferase
VLGGRCHDCRAPISIRYPIVEALVAMLFYVLAATGPLSTQAIASGEPAKLYWLAWAWECALLCVLLALAIIDRDLAAGGEGRYPLGLLGGTFVLAMVLPILLPGMLVYTNSESGPEPSVYGGLEHTALGALAGCGCGTLMYAATRGGMTNLRHAALPALVGPYLGAWPTVALVATTLLAFAAMRLVPARPGGAWWRWPFLLCAATFAAIVAAHQWPAAYARLGDFPFPLNAAILGTFLAALVAYRVVSRRRAGGIE